MAITERKELVLMENYPIAEMEFVYLSQTEEEKWPKIANWENSAVRDFLNGPYLASLPKWVVERMVPIESGGEGRCVQDKVSIFTNLEIRLFLENAPKDPQVFNRVAASKRVFSLMGLTHETDDRCSEEEPSEPCDYSYCIFDDDPLLRWEEDHRQYSKELYDEWYDEYDQVAEAHNNWLREVDAITDKKYRERNREKEAQEREELERDRVKWNASMVSYCDGIWNRDAWLFSRREHIWCDWLNAGVIPVICLSTAGSSNAKSKPVTLCNAKRILQEFDDTFIDSVREMAPAEEEALRQFVYGEDHRNDLIDVYDEPIIL